MNSPWLGAQLARIRRRARLTQRQLAARLGVRQQVVSQVERGTSSLRQAARICRALGSRLEITVGESTATLVHPLPPEERREIEANIEWFSRLDPATRLRVIRDHVDASRRLAAAASAPRK